MKRIITLLMLLALAYAANAQDEKPESKNKPSQDLEYLELANHLADYGYRTYSASSLIEAARIMSSISPQEIKFESYKQDPIPEEAVTKKSKNRYDLESILAATKKYAGGNAILLDEISQIEKAKQETRGRVGGPGERYNYVYGNSADYYDIMFRAGELAEIVVIGDGDTDLDLYIYDSNGNMIASDYDYTDRCYVSWVPLWTGRYTVKIMNRGPILNNYYLVTN